MEDDFVQHRAIQVPVFTLYATRLSTQKTPRSARTAVFVCFVWISEQTAKISLYNIN
jgi:hypothetical protein